MDQRSLLYVFRMYFMLIISLLIVTQTDDMVYAYFVAATKDANS